MTHQWNHPDADPLADLRAWTKILLEACHMCGGRRWEFYLDQSGDRPRIAHRPCSYCEGTGKLPQFREDKE